MISNTVLSALGKDLPVLFVYIGWADRYDGTEAVVGGHAYLKTHPRDNSENEAFKKDRDGWFRCGIGSGDVVEPRLHVVFLASDSAQIKRIVGIYAAAQTEVDTPDVAGGRPWAEAYTRHSLRFPVDRRPIIVDWPTGQGQRRWALRPQGQAHPTLHKFFEELKSKLPQLLGSRPVADNSEDQTYSGMEAREGEQRASIVKHRRREAKLRRAKIAAALSAFGGRLVCEVPGCEFDFFERYGDLGYGYAHVHHRRPLSDAGTGGRTTTLGDLSIVCANCHSMIHKGGECRDMSTLIPRKRRAHSARRA